jgi:hypothetical protein
VTPGNEVRGCYAAGNVLKYWDSVPTTVDYNSGTMSSCSIALVPPTPGQRPNVSPRIAYFDSSMHAIRYAQHDGSMWMAETLTSTFHVDKIQLALDWNAKPVIVYFDNDALTFKLFRIP